MITITPKAAEKIKEILAQEGKEFLRLAVQGAEIDFDESSLLGGGFKIKNPNTTSTCGCGQSFEA